MSERFRLTFRGEVLEGHHAAVVKKKLGALLKLEDERLERLFDGAEVVVRRSVDGVEVARMQAAFSGAGALLRVLPVPAEASTSETPTASDDARKSTSGTVELVAPAAKERVASAAKATMPPAASGVRGGRIVPRVPVKAPGWEVAEPGARLAPPSPETPPLPVPDFSVAPPGATLGDERRVDPPAPDTSHLSLQAAP